MSAPAHQTTLAAAPEKVYPPRDPEAERNLLRADDALSLLAFSHYGWEGKRDLRAGARILVVGEGNGDAVVLLAEQARDSAIEIIAVDTSPDALSLCKARLAKRGLTNVVHHELSVLDLPQANLGEFDIIECSHVLDHIEDPVSGLQALGAILKDDGLLCLSLNGNYGRLQLYMIQALAAQLIEDFMPREMKIRIISEFLKAVPADHWLGHDSADFIAEINQQGDDAIEALFLQSHNHTFTVGEIYQMLDMCGLSLTSFMGKDKANYRIETHTKSPMIRELLAPKMEYERDMIADLMHGGIRAHRFYAAIEDKKPAAFGDDMVITLAPSVATAAELLADLPKTPNTNTLLGLIDGKRSIGEITAGMDGELLTELEQLYNTLHLHQRVFLRHKEVKPYPSNADIQARLANIQPITYQ